MGLSIVVGLLAQQKKELDAEEFEEFSSVYDNLNTVLLQNGLPCHIEPIKLAKKNRFESDMIGYGGLHYVRRLASHFAINEKLPPPIGKYEISISDDPAIDALNARLENNGYRSRKHDFFKTLSNNSDQMFAHLMLHSDSEGFYVPQDFDDVAFDSNEPQLSGLGGMVGSAVQLLYECEFLARKLQIPTDLHYDSEPFWEFSDAPAKSGPLWQIYGIESFGLVRLIEACRVSILSGAAVAFT
jgi:hypothetical protein